jgi:hypothetical protein
MRINSICTVVANKLSKNCTVHLNYRNNILPLHDFQAQKYEGEISFCGEFNWHRLYSNWNKDFEG